MRRLVHCVMPIVVRRFVRTSGGHRSFRLDVDVLSNAFSPFVLLLLQIKNAVVKMENPTDKIIRQLKEENARLLALLSGAGIAAPVGSGEGGDGAGGAGGADVEALRAQIMAENEAK